MAPDEIVTVVDRCPSGALQLSDNKPFCDNSHLKGTFEAPGERIRVHPSGVRSAADKPMDRREDPRR